MSCNRHGEDDEKNTSTNIKANHMKYYVMMKGNLMSKDNRWY